jgi:hypothetical protein
VTGDIPAEFVGENKINSTRTAPAHRPLFSSCAEMMGYAFTVVIEVPETTVLQSRQVDSADVRLLPFYAGVRSAREDVQTR